jgi:hypothetical protein
MDVLTRNPTFKTKPNKQYSTRFPIWPQIHFLTIQLAYLKHLVFVLGGRTYVIVACPTVSSQSMKVISNSIVMLQSFCVLAFH